MKPSPNPRLVLASNRDEFYQRQGKPPEYRTSGKLNHLAPIDPKKGGTWFGLNEAGLLVALTNRLDENPYSNAPSRGLLVRHILSQAHDRREAIDSYKELEPRNYNPHRILFVTPDGLTSFYWNTETLERVNQRSGFFYLDNQSGMVTNSSALKKSLPVDFRGINVNTFPSLEHFCGSHSAMMDRESICLHAGIAGTLSSGLILLDSETDEFQYRFSQGPPCRTSYRPVEVPKSFRHQLLYSWSQG